MASYYSHSVSAFRGVTGSMNEHEKEGWEKEDNRRWEEELSLTSRVADFFSSTTIHGVGRIYRLVEN
ncbi:hypothetical protein E2C01_008159 [Portunus trituberculatus]|uniref:Uncharacterized protein n=1 Tax=Portunus trituberculatus TaxID=210409 RepID=A0A5B7D111_PORTR|nr:hypothetical protein [Portunus trituberculatus]